ncbi:hypothetical protein Hypma_010638 [Hypsizygus marmoreus]|uniref:DUF7598 domain-containing protein n=1 Tax=Hypsizygus marmoreus TaxID=39966 RepID=A0A369JS14_HYPMA|nr:hypothetical protein Hypma_010638 [Hypsizygus marmoreus]
MQLSSRAFHFMGLNAVRFLSVVSLILVFASTIFVMVTNIKAVNAFEASKGSDSEMENCDYIEGSTVPNQAAGVFWAVVSSLLIIFQTVVLLLSEIGWPSAFFDRYFPVLGTGFGLGALGIFQCLISTQILSHHVDDFTLVSAFLLFSVGCLNMFLGLIFAERAKQKRSIAAWRADSQGVLPTHTESKGARPIFVNASPATYISRDFTGSSGSEKSSRPDTAEFGTWKASTDKAGYGFGRQGEKAAGLRGFILQKPEESLPRYATPPPSHNRQESRSQHSQHHVNLTRNASVASSTSSFASPYRESTGSAPDAHANPAQAKTPVFRSSPTAL